MSRYEMPLQNDDLNKALKDWGWSIGASEARLMLAELLIKANAGSYNSHTEEGFMNSFGMLTKARKLNKKGARYICDMFYSSSNRKPEAFDIMAKYRK